MDITKRDADNLAALFENSILLEGHAVGEFCTPAEFVHLLLLAKISDSLEHMNVLWCLEEYLGPDNFEYFIKMWEKRKERKQ